MKETEEQTIHKISILNLIKKTPCDIINTYIGYTIIVLYTIK